MIKRRRITVACILFLSAVAMLGTASAATVTVESTALSVQVDDQFPRVIQYTWTSNGAVLYGQDDPLSQVRINGTNYTPTVHFSNTADQASYTLRISSINVEMDVVIKVVENRVEFNVTQIRENGATKVMSVELPDHNFLSVHSTQSGASFSGTRMYTAVSGTGDTFLPVTGTPDVDSSPVSYMYAFLNTSQLSAGLWTNSVYDFPSGGTAKENGRVQKQTVDRGGYYRTGIWSGSWLYRASGSSTTEPLPSMKVAITDDQNGDGTVDWQDGAIAFRSIMNSPMGAEQIPDLVVQRIPFNFASQATNPFLKTIDETKRVYLATDGLGQMVLLKGYQSEGHDSAHPDYDDIGTRQGGEADLNRLIEIGHTYNAFFGVHINAQESYPEADAFNESLVDPTWKGWNWLDQSYVIRKRDDANSGNRLARMQQLKSKIPHLDFIYLDVWYQDGWESRKVAREINSQGWTLFTEFPDRLEYDVVWDHWSVDYDYGGSSLKGFNSQIVRFIRNHQKDTWIARHPLLGGTEMKDHEGWRGRVDFGSMIEMTFGTNLPTKYLQHFPIIHWTSDSIEFEDNVSVSSASGTRVITKDGWDLLEGTKYLLPWDPKTEEKLYHWNETGGTSSWMLPLSWSGLSTVKLYRLTDQGRQFVGDLAVSSNWISIDADAKTPYVVYKAAAPVNPDVLWGEGSLVKDPGFNSGGLSFWSVAGDVGTATVRRNSRGQYELEIAGGGETTVSQQITGLSQGSYAATVYVEVAGGGRRAIIGVKEYGGAEVSTYTDSSFASNYIKADSKHGTKMQRMQVYFDVPSGQTTAMLYLKAGSGSSGVVFDDVRVVKATRAPLPVGAYFAEDFEHVVEGWYPFVKGPAGGTNDPRTHLSELHAPYTQKGWNGKPIDDVINGRWSLKAHEEARELLYRTLPQTVRFSPGRRYLVMFRYESQGSGDYAFVIGDGTDEVSSTPFDTATTPRIFSRLFTASSSGNSWIGVKKVTGSATDFILDDLEIQDLGSGPSPIPLEIPKTGWSLVYVDSEETVGEDGAAVNFFDDDPNTIWHTEWYSSSPAHPHEIQIDLGDRYEVNRINYLPRQDGKEEGRIEEYEIYISEGTESWGDPVASGSFANTMEEKEVTFPFKAGRYIRLVALSEVNGNPWTSGAELTVFHTGNTPPPPPSNEIPKVGWTLVYVDSEEKVGNGIAENFFDDSSSTLWHTEWYYASPPHPHEIQIDLGALYEVKGFSYLPRQNGWNGTIKEYEFYVSESLDDWGSPVSAGTWTYTSHEEKKVKFSPKMGRYIRLVALSEVNGNPWTSGAELSVFHTDKTPPPPIDFVPKEDWSLMYVDSEETKAVNRRAIYFFDSDPDTIWHTEWYYASPPHPHEVQIDLGATYEVEGFRYLPRQDGSQNGRIKEYEFYLSLNKNEWGSAVASGSLANTGREKQIKFPSTIGRYIRLVALSEVNGNPWTSGAELSLLGVLKDITPPLIVAPADITAEQTSLAGTEVDLGMPLVTDDIDPSPVVSNDAPELFPLGSTTVTWTATDASGNFATAVQQVTVKDTRPPDVIADLILVSGDDEEGLYMVEFKASDICDADPVVSGTIEVCGREIPVSSGQVIEIELDEEDECETEWEDGRLQIEAGKVMLRVIAVDFSGNVGETVKLVEHQAEGEGEEDDD